MWCHQFALTHHDDFSDRLAVPLVRLGALLFFGAFVCFHWLLLSPRVNCWLMMCMMSWKIGGLCCPREDAGKTFSTPLPSLSPPLRNPAKDVPSDWSGDLGRHWEKEAIPCKSRPKFGIIPPVDPRVMMKHSVLFRGIFLLLSFFPKPCFPEVSVCFCLLRNKKGRMGNQPPLHSVPVFLCDLC